jgi:peptidoglycan/xylan/chitin deacetylase (PgdA/CDA1 family)
VDQRTHKAGGAEHDAADERSELERLLGLMIPQATEAREQSLMSPPPPNAGETARLSLPKGRSITASINPSGGVVYAPFEPDQAYRSYVSETWSVEHNKKALSPAQLNAFYRLKQFVPRAVQLWARRRLMRWQGLPEFPGWPLDTGVSALLRFYAFCRLRSMNADRAEFRWFWPAGFQAALILTHDVETQGGLSRAVELADLEEEHGFRSAFNLGGWYDVDPGLVRELTSRGFELGVHGVRHDRSLFSSRAAFEKQSPLLLELRERFGSVGFRSPATHRVFEWMSDFPFDYDCSIPNSDPWEAQPGGCCSVWPFFIGPLVELPYTLPQDHTLFTLLGHRSPNLWVDVASQLESEYGLIQVIGHPDEGYLADARKRGYYTEFLAAMAEREKVWRALPREVAEWWRKRSAGVDGARGMIRIGDTADEVVLEPPPATSGRRP